MPLWAEGRTYEEVHRRRTGRHGGGHDEEPRERHRVGRASERRRHRYRILPEQE